MGWEVSGVNLKQLDVFDKKGKYFYNTDSCIIHRFIKFLR